MLLTKYDTQNLRTIVMVVIMTRNINELLKQNGCEEKNIILT